MSSGKWRPFCLGLNVLRLKTARHHQYIKACRIHWNENIDYVVTIDGYHILKTALNERL